MKHLTIDTKNNCYVINSEAMNHLQQNVAKSLTLEKGTFEIKITSGRYRSSRSKTEGEPFVLLWIYGVDGSTFVNLNTGLETGATWTSLNGYNNKLKLEVKNQAVLCALFFDFDKTDNQGTIHLSITGGEENYIQQSLFIDSPENCYEINEQELEKLKQKDFNSVDLAPGNYRIKIREGNATYWSNSQRFPLEPWALIWIKGGKFISRLTKNEIEETWCSLNGLQDEIILEVKANTTLSGFFFDTYKEDNEGQVTLEINSLTKAELKEKYQEMESQAFEKVGSKVSVVSTTSGSRTRETASVSSRGDGYYASSSTDFSFNFDEAQMDRMWQEMAARIQTTVAVSDEKDEKKEAAYWDNLEKWLLKGYQSQAKKLAMQVAKVEFMIKSLTQQMEANFSQNFQVWSNHFNNHLNNLFTTRIPRIVSEQVNLRITDQTQEIKNLVIGQIQNELNERVESVVNLKITNQTQEIKNLVIEQMQTELEERINNVVNVKITDHSRELNTQIVKQISGDIDQRIDNALNVKIANQAQDISNQVTQQIYNEVDQRINAIVSLKIADQAQTIKNQAIQQIQSYIDQRIKSVVDQSTDKNVQVVVNNVVKDIDNRINVNLDNKILNFRNDVSTLVKNEINQNFTDNIKATILSDLKNQQFYVDMQSIKAEVENFYARLAQFETQLYFRVEQGDTQLYNWTLEQLVTLQGCLTDRQALVEMFESFASKLKDELDNAECVLPSRFTPWVRTDMQAQLESMSSRGLPQA